MEAKLLFFSRPTNRDRLVWQYKSIPVSESYLGSVKPFSPSPSATNGYSWRVLESLIDELKTLCVEGWKIHMFEEPKPLNLDICAQHYFAKAVLTRKEAPPTTSSASPAAGSESESESDPDLVPDDEVSEKTV